MNTVMKLLVPRRTRNILRRLALKNGFVLVVSLVSLYIKAFTHVHRIHTNTSYIHMHTYMRIYIHTCVHKYIGLTYICVHTYIGLYTHALAHKYSFTTVRDLTYSEILDHVLVRYQVERLRNTDVLCLFIGVEC